MTQTLMDQDLVNTGNLNIWWPNFWWPGLIVLRLWSILFVKAASSCQLQDYGESQLRVLAQVSRLFDTTSSVYSSIPMVALLEKDTMDEEFIQMLKILTVPTSNASFLKITSSAKTLVQVILQWLFSYLYIRS